MEQQFRERFSSKMISYHFSCVDSRIEARMRLKLVLSVVLGFSVAPIVIITFLSFRIQPTGWFLAIPIGLGSLFLIIGLLVIKESRARLVIDYYGLTTTGVIYPKPTQISWHEITKFQSSILSESEQQRMFIYTTGANGENKRRIFFEIHPEIIEIIRRHIANRSDLMEQLDKELYKTISV
ncbi:MAG: hypothetical protein FWE16_01450 [Firmicutes bacterium]|nr:hypothetical protein [Bacillota bacterium]